MFYGEILFRQGTWVRKFDTHFKAVTWVHDQAILEKETVNPPRAVSVREVPGPLPYPKVPDKTFDESWPQ